MVLLSEDPMHSYGIRLMYSDRANVSLNKRNQALI